MLKLKPVGGDRPNQWGGCSIIKAVGGRYKLAHPGIRVVIFDGKGAFVLLIFCTEFFCEIFKKLML